jgi:uncharacterized membrane protein
MRKRQRKRRRWRWLRRLPTTSNLVALGLILALVTVVLFMKHFDL